MIDDADAWQGERLRRYRLAIAYHLAVSTLEGLDERTWLERRAAAFVEADTATAYALIHQHVASVPKARWDQQRGPRQFAAARRPAGVGCQSVLVWGYECPIHASASDLELDHGWPFALGGQSAPSNGVWLCRLHNRAKSHDVHNYDWPMLWPSWLLVMLKLIGMDCERAETASTR